MTRGSGEGHFPHGRIDVTSTVQRFAARGVDNKVAYSWFERTIERRNEPLPEGRDGGDPRPPCEGPFEAT